MGSRNGGAARCIDYGAQMYHECTGNGGLRNACCKYVCAYLCSMILLHIHLHVFLSYVYFYLLNY